MRAAMRAVTAVAALALAGCAVGPEYKRPAASVPGQWPGQPQAEPVVDEWWKTLKDPELESLVARAVKSNLDLQLAAARVEEARASRSLARSDFFPQVNGGAAVERSRLLVAGPSPAGFGLFPFTATFYQAQMNMSWEADVFGRVRREVQAATADQAAQQEDRRNVLVALLADVASNYAELRGYQLRLGIAAHNIEIEQQTVDLTRDLERAGQATERDVAQAESQLELTKSTVPQLETGRAAAVHRLGVLLGAEPESLERELAGAAPLPIRPAGVPVGLPSDLLERRPDIRRAEAQLVAATARVGEAKADYFPQFSLTGQAGRESAQLHLLALGVGNFFSFGPTVSVPVFTAGRIRANVAIQEARMKEAVTAYQSTVLTALEETENALVGYSNEQDRAERLSRVIKADRTALELAEVQYKAGLADFLTVLDSERALSANEDQLAASQTAVVTDLVSLYRALGGGWPAVEKQTP